MSKEIWLAPLLSDNRQRLIERASDILASGPAEALLYIAASRPLLDLAADKLLDGVRNRGVWGSLPVHLFRGFARFVLATAIDEKSGDPIPPRIAIDRMELPLKRSLLSQIIKSLARRGSLKAIAPLAGRDGCTTTIASVIGEIQRAGKTPSEFSAIVNARAQDFYGSAQANLLEAESVPRQVDFDREIALIYAAYAEILTQQRLTEDDSDQLRALHALRGELDGMKVNIPWLRDVRLLVLDGFFDFTPVQDEMIRILIPRVPDVIVNLNRDPNNIEVFRPFLTTAENLNSVATFDQIADSTDRTNDGSLAIRVRLFNPDSPVFSREPSDSEVRITLLECANREAEVRAIAKRIRKTILIDGVELKDIAVVVRDIAPYGETIRRIFQTESIPCSLNSSIPLTEVPAVSAAQKLLELVAEEPHAASIKAGAVADVLKSQYFRLSDDELASLAQSFESKTHAEQSGKRLWDVDEFENAVAFVGAQLRIDNWLKRARLLSAYSQIDDTERAKTDEEDDLDTDDSSAEGTSEVKIVKAGRISFEAIEVPLPGSDRRAKPARDLDSKTISWSAAIIERLARLISAVPREGKLQEIVFALRRLFEKLQFAPQVRGAAQIDDRDLPAIALDLRGLEGLRRALTTATRAIELCRDDPTQPVSLTTVIDETLRCLKSQSLTGMGQNKTGIRVLEATDVRGLRFRTLFIAGMAEGMFPLRPSRDWIYPYDERESLRRYGLSLEDISANTLLKEEHYFYQAACRATEQLFISRPLVLEDGSETVPSYYIEELSNAIAPSEISREIVGSEFDGDSLFDSSTPIEFTVALVRQDERRRHRAQRDGVLPAETISRLFELARSSGYLSALAERRIDIERRRAGDRFGHFDGTIDAGQLLKRLAGQYGQGHAFSASELSLFGKCPFKFFVEKVLRLEPRGEAAMDLSALDAGSLLHEVLRRFFEKYRGAVLTELGEEQLRRDLREIADQVFTEHERTIPPLNPQVWKIDRENRKLLLEQVLNYELGIERKARAKGVRPAHFELAFGMGGTGIDPSSTDRQLEMHRDAGEPRTIRIRGQIDRVDRSENDKLIAYDYKLSKGASLDDMQDGRALQLHIYLAALEQLFSPDAEMAGAGYYTMKANQDRRTKGLYRITFNDYTGVSRKANSNLSDEDWNRVRSEMQSRIWQFVDEMRDGRFKVAPSSPDDSCPHCDFSAVCRYEKFRIRRKTGSQN